MAPIKFEDNLKEKLEQRRLQPSASSWETLHNRLDNNRVKKINKTFLWLGIAASFIGILIVASMFFNNETSNKVEQSIVDIEDTKIPNENDSNSLNDIEQKFIFEEIQVENPLININNHVEDLKPILQNQQDKLIKETINETVTEVSARKVNEKTIAVKTLTFEDIKLLEVVAQVQALKKANHTVSDDEINALLDQAQKDIALHKLYSESTKKVDANALLQDVEADLEQSFRDRAFKAIKSGYNYVKTTVAERNN